VSTVAGKPNQAVSFLPLPQRASIYATSVRFFSRIERVSKKPRDDRDRALLTVKAWPGQSSGQQCERRNSESFEAVPSLNDPRKTTMFFMTGVVLFLTHAPSCKMLSHFNHYATPPACIVIVRIRAFFRDLSRSCVICRRGANNIDKPATLDVPMYFAVGHRKRHARGDDGLQQ